MKAFGVFVNGKCVYKTVHKKRAYEEAKLYKPELKTKWFDTEEDYDAAQKQLDNITVEVKEITLER